MPGSSCWHGCARGPDPVLWQLRGPGTRGSPRDDCKDESGARCRTDPCERGPPLASRPRAPCQSDRHQCAGIRQRRGRGYAARARHPLYRAKSGRQLSRPARLDRELPRQRDAADAVVPARGGRRCDCARLRQGHRQGDGGGGTFQRRAVPRHHGDLQCLVRPHAGGDAGRNGPGRRRQAAAMDRLDPHRARPGRDRARLHQVGRSAGLPGRRPRVAHPRHLDRQYRADGTGLHQSRCRDAGSRS